MAGKQVCPGGGIVDVIGKPELNLTALKGLIVGVFPFLVSQNLVDGQEGYSIFPADFPDDLVLPLHPLPVAPAEHGGNPHPDHLFRMSLQFGDEPGRPVPVDPVPFGGIPGDLPVFEGDRLGGVGSQHKNHRMKLMGRQKRVHLGEPVGKNRV